MTRISLQTIETLAQLQLRPQTVPQHAILSRLAPGDVVRAQVVGNLGNGLYSLSLAGAEIVAASAAPLTPGQLLSLQVSTTGAGPARLHVLTLVEGRIAAVAERPALEGLENRAAQAAAKLAAETNTSTRGSAVSAPESAPLGMPAESGRDLAATSLARLIQPQGQIARLLADRPDLVPRIEQLLRYFASRPDGAGAQVQGLAEQLGLLLRQSQDASAAGLSAVRDRLLGQLVDAELLDQPGALAQELASRFGDLARGLEGVLARLLRAAPAAPGGSDPAAPVSSAAPAAGDSGKPIPNGTTSGNESAGSGRPEAATLGGRDLLRTAALDLPAAATGRETAGTHLDLPVPASSAKATPADVLPSPAPAAAAAAPRGDQPVAPPPDPLGTASVPRQAGQEPAENGAGAERTSPAARTAELVQGAFEGDLKGQLLELRTRLEQLAQTQPDTRGSVQPAIARTNQLLDLVTGQQVRNVDGLNQFVYAELPVDPRTGIGEARLQVFYRRQPRGVPTADDPDRFTVALFLNLTRLGDVLAVVTGIGQAAQVSFTVQSPAAEKLLAQESDGLREGLLGAGYAGVTVTVWRTEPATSVNDRTEPVWDDFVKTGQRDPAPGYRLNRRI